MKAILVIDIKEGADIKTLRANFEVYEDIHIKPCYQSCYQLIEGIELKPMPLKRETQVHWKSVGGGDIPTHEISDYDKGWNDCIDFLEGDMQDD